MLAGGAPAGAREPAAEGFGIGAYGGYGGTDCWVSSLADAGRNTLRSCAEHPDSRYIRFGVSGTVRLETRLLVGPNKTIDGAGQQVTITNRRFLLRQPNVIVRNLTFDVFDSPQVQDDPEDGIEVDGASPVWIDHNRFSNAQDKAIQVTASRAITVSANHFVNQAQIV